MSAEEQRYAKQQQLFDRIKQARTQRETVIAVGHLFVDVISRIQNKHCDDDVEQQVLDFLDGRKSDSVLSRYSELLN